MYRVYEANNKTLYYDASVNDHHIWHYHRDNGFTKISIHKESWLNGKKINITTSVLRVLEGQLEAASLVNKAYIKNIFPNTTVMTGVNFYPYKFSLKMISGVMQDQVSKIGLPLCLTICLPVFMQAIVQEKETKLTEMMKINGL